MNQSYVNLMLIFLRQEWNNILLNAYSFGVSIYILAEKCNMQIEFPIMESSSSRTLVIMLQRLI